MSVGSRATSAMREPMGLLRFLVGQICSPLDDRFNRGRSNYEWEKKLKALLEDSYPQMQGRWAVVTGANSGIGYQVALMLAKCGVSVILGCRSDARGKEAECSIRAELGEHGSRVEYHRLDVADLSSVTQFAKSMKGRDVSLLVCNAGAMCLPWSLTPQGFETVFGTHVMGHALLAEMLLPEMLRCAKGTARIVYVSSRTVEHGEFLKECFARPEQAPQGFDRYAHYSNVKMTQTCCALAQADQLGAGNVAVHAVHPGCVYSSIISNSRLLGPFSGAAESISWVVGQISPIEAASYVLRVCLAKDCAPENGTGQYFHCGQPSNPGPWASDTNVKKEAWSLVQHTLYEGGWVNL